jgi:hypothetical protein
MKYPSSSAHSPLREVGRAMDAAEAGRTFVQKGEQPTTRPNSRSNRKNRTQPMNRLN